MKTPLQRLRIASIVSILGSALAGLGGSPAAAAACRLPQQEPAFTMEVLVDGRPVREYAASGTTYIEALKGREYQIRLTNRTGERVAVALAVDGLNSIDAKHTSAREARKWILAPWETTTLSGWQTGSGTARRFVFTSESSSYGAWLGRTSDLGVISAAFFRESRRADAIVPVQPFARPDAQGLEKDMPAPPTAMPESGARDQGAAAGGANRAERRAKAAASDELAATGIGREIEHHVVQVEFDAEDAPASTLSVRYEYRDALVRLGVIPRVDDALARRERARGFAEPGFAPDPFRRR